MNESTFQRFREIVYDKSGISLGDNKQALVRSRISKRMRNLKIDDFEAYLKYVLHDTSGVEIENMLDVISTNTTNFYREAAHFDMMRKVIKGWINKGQRTLRVWSAASSSGEEPYTLAIEILETTGQNMVDTKILATDIAPSVLQIAMKGEYSEDRIEPIPKNLRNKYLLRRKVGEEYIYCIKDEPKNLILYRQFNLSIVPYPIRNDIDIIFCRNVMIYFDRQVRTRLIKEFYRLLKPGGYLFIGHAESITGLVKGFNCIKPSVYIKG